MSQLPSAHAAQSFGARRIDYFAVGGQVIGSDPRAGSAERRVQDDDGMLHEVRLLDRDARVRAGDVATVLRVQSGPDRRSRPVAIVNHTDGSWTRCAPEAMSVLGRAGITRSLNWWLSLLLLALTAIVALWPELHRFASEVNRPLVANVPAFDVFAEIEARAPGLSGWRLELALPSGLFDTLAGLGWVPMSQLTEWGLGLGAALLAVLAFTARSWRPVYMPALAAYAILAGAILGTPDACLAVLGVAAAVFLAGGLVNRIRDASRFNARVERLAEHVLRHPPQEAVLARTTIGRTPETTASDATAPQAVAAAATAAVLTGEAQAIAEPGAEDRADPADAAPAAEESANGEADAAPPVIADTENESEMGPDGAASLTLAVPSESEGGADAGAGEEDESDPTAIVAGRHEGAAEASAGDAPGDGTETPLGATPDAPPQEEAPEPASPDAADASPTGALVEDDLPDEAALAAARAAAESEAASVAGGVVAAQAETPDADTPAPPPASIPVRDSLDDERTMPVAPPPPMPEPDTQLRTDHPVRSGEAPVATEEDASADDQTRLGATSEAAAESDDADALAGDPAPSDDPVLTDGVDPMMSSEGQDPYAPGAPVDESSSDAEAETDETEDTRV